MNKKKLFSGISSAVLILGSLSPIQAFAQAEEMAFTETADNAMQAFGPNEEAFWKIQDGVLTIEGECNFPYVKDNNVPGWPWYERRDEVKKVNFGKGFTLSGSAAGMFQKMSNLEEIDFSNFKSENLTNMYAMFSYCKNLLELDLSKFDTPNVENMTTAFFGCNALRKINLNGFKTDNTKSMHAMFGDCNSLQSLDLSDFDTTNVSDMHYMFAGCSALTSLDLSSFYTPNVNEMDMMFLGCSRLSSIKLDHFDTTQVTNMEKMFAYCPNLKEIDLRQLWITDEAAITNMFGGDTRPQTVWINNTCKRVLEPLTDVSPKWHLNQKGPYSTDYISEEMKNSGEKLAQLDLALTYNLYYASEGEGYVSDLPVSQEMSSLTGKCKFTVSSTVPKRSGYTFLGWSDDQESAQVKYAPGSAVEWNVNNEGQVKTLFAVWRRNSNSSSGSSSSSNRVNLSSVHEMHRLYNPNSGEHFYTKETAERDHLVNVGWNYEGTAWYSPKSSSSPVYRLYNPNAGDHHYTLDAKEKDELVKLGWKYEGIGWYSASKSNGQAIHRQYNPNAVAGAHNFTTDENERDFLINNGWSHEGIAWYGVHPKNIKK